MDQKNSGCLTKEYCVAVYLFVCKRWFKDMVKRASWLKTAFYVKCCSVSLMRAYGGC